MTPSLTPSDNHYIVSYGSECHGFKIEATKSDDPNKFLYAIYSTQYCSRYAAGTYHVIYLIQPVHDDNDKQADGIQPCHPQDIVFLKTHLKFYLLHEKANHLAIAILTKELGRQKQIKDVLKHYPLSNQPKIDFFPDDGTYYRTFNQQTPNFNTIYFTLPFNPNTSLIDLKGNNASYQSNTHFEICHSHPSTLPISIEDILKEMSHVNSDITYYQQLLSQLPATPKTEHARQVLCREIGKDQTLLFRMKLALK